jgi:hypothetical protein
MYAPTPPALPAHHLDEQIVLGALVRGTLSPRDVDGWAPAESYGDLHRRIFFALLASLAVCKRVELPRVLVFVGSAAGTVWSDGRAHGYLPDLARGAPGRGGAVRAIGRLFYAARLAEDERVRKSDRAVAEVHQMAEAARRRRERLAPSLLRAIAEVDARPAPGGGR